jgi:N-formylglutamate amidohydrolase
MNILWIACMYMMPSIITCSEFIHIQQGNIPILLTAPHGGRLDVQNCKERTEGSLHADLNTLILATSIGEQLAYAGLVPYCVGLTCKRKYVDVNRPAKDAYENEQGEIIYRAYHAQIKAYISEITKNFPDKNPLLIDIHGQGKAPSIIFRGTQDKNTVERLLKKCGNDALNGPDSILGYLSNEKYGIYPPVLSIDHLEDAAYNGGFTVFSYGSHSATGIDAIQLEFGSDFRKRENIVHTAKAIANAIIAFHHKWQL